jgi:4-cresol dehydrogenase (hydroxylating)
MGEEVERECGFAPSLGVPNLRSLSTVARNKRLPFIPEGMIWVSLMLPHDGNELIRANEVLTPLLKELGIWSGMEFMTPYPTWERALKLAIVALTTQDQEWNEKVVEGLKKVIQVGAENGWPEFRSHPVLQETVRETYNYSDGALLQLHDDIKDVIDPNGILSPGRYGIWPKDMRDKNA